MIVCNSDVPYFSIITPVYNREKCISNAISSIIKQTFENWEYIIVNDGSADNTGEIIDEVSNTDERIKPIHFPYNKGVSAARNAGIKAAKGEYLLFLDSDDEFSPLALKALQDFLCSEKDIDVIVFQGSRHTSVPVERKSKTHKKILLKDDVRSYVLPVFLGVLPQSQDHIHRPVLWNKCVKKTLFWDNEIFFDTNKKTWEDEEVSIKVFDVCEKVLIFDEPLINERTFDVLNHLSASYYTDGAKNVLFQYKWMLKKFGANFDFYSEFALDFHFKRIQTWIWRTMSKDNNRKNIVLEILRDEAFRKLLDKRIPKGIFEKSVRIFLKLRMYLFGYMVYWLQNKINGGQTF